MKRKIKARNQNFQFTTRKPKPPRYPTINLEAKPLHIKTRKIKQNRVDTPSVSTSSHKMYTSNSSTSKQYKNHHMA